MASAGKALIGRSQELDELVQAFVSARHAGVVVAGETGVGKSRLIEEYLQALGERVSVTANVRATRSMAAVPFGVFASLVPFDSEQAVSSLDVLRGLTATLSRAAAGRQAVVCVDDAHLLDDASAALVLLLAHTGRAFVVVGVRTGEPTPDAVTSLWKEEVAERLELQALTEPETMELISGLLGAPIAPTTRRQLWEWTHGNPLFAREVVMAGGDRGALFLVRGMWQWCGPLAHTPRLAELVQMRLRDIESIERQVLELLAVGEPLEASLVLELTDPGAVIHLEEQGLVRVEWDGRRSTAKVSHPLYGEVVAQSMSRLRVAEVRRALAGWLEQRGTRRQADLLRMLTWRLDAGQAMRDPSMLMAGARRALGSARHVLAERLAVAAEDAGGGSRASVIRAEALYWQGRHSDAHQLLGLIPFDLLDSDEDRVRAATVDSSALFWGLGRLEEAETVLRRAMSLVRDPAFVLDLEAHHASVAFFAGRVHQAIELATSILTEPQARPQARLRALVTAAAGWGVHGDLAAAVGAAELGLTYALADEIPNIAGELALAKAFALALAGELDQAATFAEAVYGLAVAENVMDLAGAFLLLIARICLSSGRPVSALKRLGEAEQILTEHDAAAFLPWCQALMAHAAALQGNIGDAEAALARSRQSRNPAVGIYEADVEVAQAWISVARGERSRAMSQLEQAALRAESAGIKIAAAEVWHDLARLQGPARALPNLIRVTGGLDAPFVIAYVAHVQALADRHGPRLEAVAATFEALGARLLATEVLAEAATIHDQAGRQARRIDCLHRAEALLRQCEGAVTPTVALLTQAAPLALLTNREREVVELAARGLTNRQIADRLFVSVRTVNNHLNRAYAKLGFSERSTLASLLPPGTTDVEHRSELVTNGIN